MENFHAPVILAKPIANNLSIVIPLLFSGELLGVILIGDKFSQDEYSDKDKHLLQTMANCIASSLKNSSLLKKLSIQKSKLNKTLYELESFFDTGKIAHATEDKTQLYEDLLFRGISLMNSSGGILFLKQNDSPICTIEAILNPNEASIRSELFTKNFSLFHSCEETKTCVIKNNEMDRKLEKTGWKHIIIAPVNGPQAVHGYLMFGDKESLEGIIPFNEDDAQIMEVIAMQAGIAIENRSLIHNIEKEKTSIQNIIRSIGNGIITLNFLGEVDSFNSNAAEILQKRGDEFMSHPYQYVFDGNPRLIELISRCIETGCAAIEPDTHYYGKNFELNINFTASPLLTSDGDHSGAVISIENITEELRVRNMFKRYVSEAVVDQIIDNKLDLGMGGALKDVAILFADIRGFTAMSEKMQPDEVVSLLNDYFSVMINIILENNGLLDKIVGDELMVVFGSPVENSEKNDIAVKTAIDMMKALKKFNQSISTKLEIGIGINSGKVISGNIGSEMQSDFTVIGDNVNLASRLCSRAGKGEIVISDKVQSKLKSSYPLEKMAPFSVKGKSDKISAFKIKW